MGPACKKSPAIHAIGKQTKGIIRDGFIAKILPVFVRIVHGIFPENLSRFHLHD
jgi:hypothetical protein